MFRAFFQMLLGYMLAPLIAVAKSEAAKASADAKADLYRRASQADEEKMPDLAQQLRAFAATLDVDTQGEQPPALPQFPANGDTPKLPAPRRGRPRKEKEETQS